MDVEDGSHVLLRKRGRKSSLFRRLDVDLDVTVSAKNGWKNAAKALFAGWDSRFRLAILADSRSDLKDRTGPRKISQSVFFGSFPFHLLQVLLGIV